jgi:sulfonate transport system ATP-binding protein
VTAPALTAPRRRTGVLVEQVVRTFGDRTVLDELDLTIEDEELVVLLGPSGCGKSTLLRLLAGLDRPDGGRIEVPAKRAIVFQGNRLLPWQRVLRNVTLGLRGPDADQRARRALADVHLADRERPGPNSFRAVKRSVSRWRAPWWPNRS